MKIYNNKFYVFYLTDLFRDKSHNYKDHNINKKKIKSFTIAILIILSLSFAIFSSTLSKSMAQSPEDFSQRSLPSENKPSDKTPSENKPSDKTPSENKPSDKTPSENKPSDKTPSVNIADQSSLLNTCLQGGSECSPPIGLVNRDIFQRPFTVLETKEVILQLRPNLVPVVDIGVLANEIAQSYNLVILNLIDTPGYKAVVIKDPGTGSAVFGDNRFANDEIQGLEGHLAQLKWNQTTPYGIERTTPLTSAAEQTGGSSSNSATATNATHEERTVDADIAVLDTGISLSHPDLNVYRNVSFVQGTTSGDDDNGHGSHVAGIAAAKDNSIGVVGEAPGARLWAIKVCDGSGECKISNQMKGIEYAIKHADEIDVLNISVENPNSSALNNIISEAVKAGITVVVSAGNYGRDASTTTPANNPNVLAVSAIGDSDGKCGSKGPAVKLANGTVADDSFAYFSNFGRVVKIAAPGVHIFSTYKGSGYAVDSGTSMAAPYVAGAAAVYKSQFPNASPTQTMASITLGATT
jgi:hypothetical protein